MARLVTGKRDISIREHVPDRSPRRLSRRQGSILAAVTNVVATAAEPLRVRDIHTAVEEFLGEPVPYSSVKDALASHARGVGRRFRCRRRGCYEPR
jgi:hypothetical protein